MSTSGAPNGASGNVGGNVGSAGAPSIDFQACTSNSQCEVVAAGCCGSCGAAGLSNYTAINSSFDGQFGQRCGDIACAPCPPVSRVMDPNDPTFYYAATCRAGHCAVVDLRATAITECQSAADCSLRSGIECCTACAGPFVALNSKNEPQLSALVCGSEPAQCPACAPMFPDEAVACTDGRCSVVRSPCTAADPCPL